MKRKMIWMAALTLMAAVFSSTAYAACPTEESHRYGPWKTKTSATCTRQGHQFRYCQKCDHWEQRRTPKLPHTPGEMTVTKEPTCTEQGKQEAVCMVCGNLIKYSIDKLPHAYGEMVVVQEPTCTKNGKGEYTCADCGQKKTETIAKLGHDWGETIVIKEPTCKSTGTGEQTCTRCGKTQTVKIDKLEHVYGEWTVTQEPDGKKKGVRESVCTLCGETKTSRFYAEGTLYEDMEPCEEVIRLQEMLKDLGYYNGSIRSGQFGQLTTTAVARFQKEHELEDTGLADVTTVAVIESEWEKATGKRAVTTLDAQEMQSAIEAQPIAQ